MPLTVAPVAGEAMATDGFFLSLGWACTAVLPTAENNATLNAAARIRSILVMMA
jgi:hypothetical protein